MAKKSKQASSASSVAQLLASPTPLISAKKARAGISKFNDELRARYRRELTIRQRADREAVAAMSPLIEMMKANKESIEAIERRRKILASRSEAKAQFPKFKGKIDRHIRAGSILTVEVPPYDFDWGDHSADVGPLTWGTFVTATDGNFNATTQAKSGGDAWASAGVGKWFIPVGRDSTYVRIGLFAPYQYSWWDTSSIATAHTDGFLGVLVQSWDLAGNNFQTDIDRRIPLWSDGSSWYENHNDDGAGNYPSDTYFWAYSSRQYAVWAWCGVSCDGESGSIVYSQAFDTLSVSLAFLVLEQWT